MIITQPKELIGAFVNVRQGNRPDTQWGNYNALGYVRGGTLVAGVIFNGYEAANANMHVGAVGTHWLTRDFLAAVFNYPFVQLGKRRVTAYMKSRNKKAIKFATHLGFEYEGRMNHYYAEDDLLVYGMLRDKCRYLQELRKAA